MTTQTPQLLFDFYRLSFGRANYRTMGESAKDEYQYMIRRFQDCLGSRAQVADLTPANYFRFKTWLEDRYSRIKTHDVAQRFLALWRFANSQGAAEPCPFGSDGPLVLRVPGEVSP